VVFFFNPKKKYLWSCPSPILSNFQNRIDMQSWIDLKLFHDLWVLQAKPFSRLKKYVMTVLFPVKIWLRGFSVWA
jgi:hypothetical protein